MPRVSALFIAVIAAVPFAAAGQTLSRRWEELTGPDFPKALEQAGGVCLLPFGIIEKHGPSGPLETDLLNVRYSTTLATRQEFAIIFPEYRVQYSSAT